MAQIARDEVATVAGALCAEQDVWLIALDAGSRAGPAAAVKPSDKKQQRAPFGRKQQTQEKPSPAPVPMPVGGAAIGGQDPPKQHSQQQRAEVDRLKPASGKSQHLV